MQEWRTNRLQDRLRATTALITVLAFVVTQTAAYALPTGGVVKGGSATINSSGNTMNINQASNKAIIDWSTFNIGSNQSVIFQQPSASAIALNRIHDNNPSQILGNLSANGQVWLLNSNGVMFGSGAQVNVGGMLASTANISNSNFMAGNFVFDQPGNPNGSIINNGNISVADGGLLAMVAPTVINNGTITARLGMVQMASGDTFTLDMYGDGLINLQASNAVTTQLVRNSGKIVASGGKVSLTAATAANVLDSLINMDGVIQADSVGNQNGVITLYAAGSNAVANNIAANKGQSTNISTTLVSGNISAQGANTGETGGSITVTADHVGILTGANINASGDAGGGTIKIGGDFHGQGLTPTAIATVVQSGATILANSITTGNGGNVTVWSDNYTNFAGFISARGGSVSGNGGYVETSGHQLLSATGTVDASAAHGQTGTWLLDPEDVVLTNFDSDENGGDGSGSFTPGNSQATSDINVSHIEASLNAGTSVTVTTGGDNQNGPNGGSIEVAVPITATGTGTALTVTGSLTLSSYKDIVIDSGATITLGGGTNLSSATVAGGGLTLDANNANTGAGAIVVAANISTNGGNITLGGGTNPATMAAIGDAGNTAGISLSGTTLNAGTGGISIIGQGYSGGGTGVSISGGTVEVSGSNGINLTGAGGATGGGDTGVIVDGNVQTSGAGAIAITGYGGGNNGVGYNRGVTIGNDDDVAIQSTANGGGGITVIGYGGGSGTASDGNVGIYDNGGYISSVSGNIILTGNTGNAHSISNATGNNGHGIELTSGGAWTEIVSSTGNITMNAVGVNGATGIYSNNGANMFIGKDGAADPYSGNITFIADSLSLTGNGGSPLAISTTGNVTFAPHTSGTTVGVGTGSGNLSISDALLGDTTAGTLTTGDGVNAGAMDIDTAHTFAAPTTFITSGGANAITLASNVASSVASGNAFTFNGPVKENANNTISSGNGNITFDSTINDTASGTHSLAVNAGTGTVTFDGAIGNIHPLASLTVDPTVIDLDGNVTTTGNQTYTGSVQLGANADLTSNGTITFSDLINGDHNLTADAATFSFGGAIGGNTPLAAVSLTSTNSMTLPSISAASVTAQTTGASADLTLANGTAIDASGAGNAIVLAAGGNFINDSGSNSPLVASSGDWHVYSTQGSGDVDGASAMNPATTVYGTTYPTTTGESANTWFYSAAGSGGGGSGGGSSGSGSESNSWLYLQFPQIGNGGPCGAQGGGAGDEGVAQAVENGGGEVDLSAPSSSPCNGGGGSGVGGGSASLQSDPNSGPATATLVSSNNQRNSPRNNIASSNTRRGGSRTRRDQDLQLPDLSDL